MAGPQTKAAKRQKERRAYMASIRVEIDGRLTAPVPPEKHGSTSTYNNLMCRCVPCTDAARISQAAWLAKQKETRARNRDRQPGMGGRGDDSPSALRDSG